MSPVQDGDSASGRLHLPYMVPHTVPVCSAAPSPDLPCGLPMLPSAQGARTSPCSAGNAACAHAAVQT